MPWTGWKDLLGASSNLYESQRNPRKQKLRPCCPFSGLHGAEFFDADCRRGRAGLGSSGCTLVA
ncbi:hypothetical protein [Rubritalea tangerina]|uniref:hypothetical protein n=1 Tax=Rubritalea tangerina TaxID=430798 RepID=UPI003617B425